MREPEPDLDHLAVEDLGRGDSPRAWNIVFVGDGYAADEQALYRDRVASYVTALRRHDSGFVAMAPDAFRFYRVDAVGKGWQLGTHLDRSGSCDQPMIASDPELVGRAARNAIPNPDVIVLIAHALDGRANAGVHISDLDDWRVLEHELSHALFNLGDEYTEFAWCPTPPVEAELLATPNVTSLGNDAKWSGHVTGIEQGGGRWPCNYHPTDSCIMGSRLGGAYCAVCGAAVRETIDARLCGADREPPRIALLERGPLRYSLSRSGETLALEAAAFDEGSVIDVRFLVDGTPQTVWGRPWHEIDLDTLAPGQHTIEAQAIDSAGNIGTSAPTSLEIAHVRTLAPEVVALEVTPLGNGWVSVTTTATPLGGTLAIGAGADVVTVPIETTSPFVTFVPGGRSNVSVVARTARGIASAPRSVAVPAVVLGVDPPVIHSIAVAGAPITGLSFVAAQLDVSVHVRSCAPIDRVEVTEPISGKQLGIGTAENRWQVCDYEIRVPLAVVPGPAVVTAFDRFGRSMQVTVVLPPIADVAATCLLEPRIEDPLVALARPADIALARPGGHVIASSVAVAGTHVTTFPITRNDGTRGALLAARDIPGAPRDGDRVDLRVTALGNCGTRLGAVTGVVPVIVDAVAPRLRVHRFRHAGEPLLVESDAAIETVANDGSTIVRAVDPAGNVTQREVVPVVFPHVRQGCPQ